jgi:2-oxoglutarate ferredoxin oxidoreductase subunit alpha
MEYEKMNVTLCGGAGLGIQTVEYLFTKILNENGYLFYASKEYESRVRGGSNSTTIQISNKAVKGFSKKIDILIPFDKDAVPHLKNRIEKGTLIFSEKEFVDEGIPFIEFPIKKIAKEAGIPQGLNSVALGFLCNLLDIKNSELLLKNFFEKKGEEAIEKNLKAYLKGFEEGEKILKNLKIKINIRPKEGKRILWDGSQAVAFGALAGGCNFIATYPMSPSTGVFKDLAEASKDFDIVPIQCEDEIAVANMAIGAWYGGGRAMVTTSGGGFALMCEALSLAGAMESPLVIHLAQRPGPATGLPTRTEQADLNLALYAGHGEFPRAILAPSSIESCFYLTQKAFYLADKFQIPVFLLTDQHLLDSFYPLEEIKYEKIENFAVETKEGYLRYKFTENGISPRGIPGFGEGLVIFDSHEHTEEGHITEEEELRIKMVEKRNKKEKQLKEEALEPIFFGEKNYKNLIVSWGSTYHTIKEALEKLNLKDTAILHFEQVLPISKKANIDVEKAKKLIFIEGNYSCQFEKLFYYETGRKADKKFLKYSGAPFSVEEIENFLKEV